MVTITVSYRRNDSDAITGRIFDRLVGHYGQGSVFRDIDNIPLGIDYRKHITGTLATTDVLLAIVGPEWIGQTPDGSSRIREETDLVRIEVETALRKNIPVIPVLVSNATMPQSTDLPDGLQDFAFRQAVKVDAREDFDDHVRRLIRGLDRLLQIEAPSAQQVPKQTGLDVPASGDDWTAGFHEISGNDFKLQIRKGSEHHLLEYVSGFRETLKLDGILIDRKFSLSPITFNFEMAPPHQHNKFQLEIDVGIVKLKTAQLWVDNKIIFSYGKRKS